MNQHPPEQPGDHNHSSYWNQHQAGWYPDGTGATRWWDGQQWTHHTAPNPQFGMQQTSFESEKSTALLAHLLGLFTGFLGPLIIYLTVKDDQPFAKHHAAEALNFQLTVLIASLVSIILVFVLIGIVMIFVVAIYAFVFAIVATVAANRGEWYRYPVNFRMVSGGR